jgi:ppGpp synthetase/RelA/SpoT-type nucleotidyltranferase
MADLATFPFTDGDRKLVKALVKHYVNNRNVVEVMLSQLHSAVAGSESVMQHIHSTKARTKDPKHLADKLFRKIKENREAGRELELSESDLFKRINDLAGLRLMHLHSSQIVQIDQELQKLFAEFRYEVVEGPKARTWDIEYKQFYESNGIATVDSPKMYTSVHYVVAPNRETSVTAEIQVRTLSEELWGEVDHSINYPHETKSETCKEQIKVLARVTSSCSRLVDSIYRSVPPERKKEKKRVDK